MKKSAKESQLLNSSLEKKLAVYVSAAGAAGVSLLAMAPTASAKVIYTPAHLSLNGNMYLDLNHDGKFDIGIRTYGGCISEEVGSLCFGGNEINASSYQLGRFLGGPDDFTPALFAGAKISPSAQFSARQVIAGNFYRFFSGTVEPAKWYGPFANGGKGVRDRYIGFKFNVGSQAHYGWLRVSVQIKNPKEFGYSAFVTGYAYETEPNKGIIAGQTSDAEVRASATDLTPIPAGSRLGLLARGADGVSIWRREEVAASA